MRYGQGFVYLVAAMVGISGEYRPMVDEIDREELVRLRGLLSDFMAEAKRLAVLARPPCKFKHLTEAGMRACHSLSQIAHLAKALVEEDAELEQIEGIIGNGQGRS